ncbi:hypothetical protein [Pontimicrobium sp. MEBiC06410]
MSVKTILFYLFLGMVSSSFSQSFNYQAVVRDAGGELVIDQSVTVQFTILEGASTTVEVYKETHTTNTNTYGLLIANIGEGVNITGDFTTINWGVDKHFLKTEIDTGSGFVTIGTSEFRAVPYALYAENTANSSPFAETSPNVVSGINTNADFIIGSNNTEDSNNINLDSRLFFDKSKVAFRAGTVDGTQWNDSNRGLYSFAGGRNTKASGIGATAFGYNTEALTSYSMATGVNTAANGYASLTTGLGTKSNNVGQLISGKYNIEKTNALFIIGNGTDDATRQNAFLITENGSLILGANQFNNQDEISYDNSRLYFNKSKGAFRAGWSNDILGGSTWDDNNVGVFSTAFGKNTLASGVNSTALGQNTIASGNSSTAIGKFNEADDNALFMIGNGNSGLVNANRNTIFKVMGNGIVNIQNLSGTDTRNVKVNANGDLITTTNTTQNYTISPYDFEASFPDAELRRNYSTVKLLDNTPERAVTGVIHIPDNSVITGYTVNYLDNSSTTNFQFSLTRVNNNSNIISTISTATSSGSSSSNRTEIISGLSIVVNNANYSYVVRVVPLNGQNWDPVNTHLKSIIIQYESN